MSEGRIPGGFDECPDAETLAAYLDGTLDPAERERVETHAANCGDCRAILADTVEFLESEQHSAPAGIAATAERRDRVLRFRPPWRSGVVSILALAATLAVVVQLEPEWFPWGNGRTNAAVRTLVQAVDRLPSRPVEARLSGGFSHHPPPVVTRGAPGREVDPEVQIAAVNVALAATGEAATQRAARGVAALTTGDVDQAILELETAGRQAPGNAAVLNDLAAAYLARAARAGGTQDWQAALTTADRALSMAPTMAEALFNRALALDGVGAASDARQAWQAYLAVDPSSAWAAEARTKCPDC